MSENVAASLSFANELTNGFTAGDFSHDIPTTVMDGKKIAPVYDSLAK